MSAPVMPLSVRLRFSLCLMLGAWPLITLLLLLLTPVSAEWPLPLRTAVIVPLMVLGMVFVIIPLTNRYATRWVHGKK